jgi:hypothetical protein
VSEIDPQLTGVLVCGALDELTSLCSELGLPTSQGCTED